MVVKGRAGHIKIFARLFSSLRLIVSEGLTVDCWGDYVEFDGGQVFFCFFVTEV